VKPSDSPALYLLAPGCLPKARPAHGYRTGRRRESERLTTVVDTIVARKKRSSAFAWRPRGASRRSLSSS